MAVTDWGPVIFATCLPLLLTALAGGVLFAYRLGRWAKGIDDRLEVLETAALEGPGAARTRRRELEHGTT